MWLRQRPRGRTQLGFINCSCLSVWPTYEYAGLAFCTVGAVCCSSLTSRMEPKLSTYWPCRAAVLLLLPVALTVLLLLPARGGGTEAGGALLMLLLLPGWLVIADRSTGCSVARPCTV